LADADCASNTSALPAPPAAGGKKGGDNKQQQKPKGDNKPKEEKKAKEEKKPKEQPKAKEEKPKKKDDDEEDDFDLVPKEKKADHPFKIMDTTNPSPFVMDAWKRCYSNCHGDYEGAMKTFWETFDAQGWSIWRGDYQYNDECKILFMTSNLIAGFIQRTDEIRKWLFGTMTIRGNEEAKNFKITCYYLIRGQEIQPLIACNDDAACYKWTKMSVPATDTEKQLLFDYWTSDTTLEGEAVLDSRCYK